MIKQNNEKAQVFWLGFAFGTVSASALIYFLGTKKGRKSLQNIIDFSENLEENLIKIINKDKKVLNEKKEHKTIAPIEKISLIINEIKRISNNA